jgi:hypothetical protein
MRRLQVGVTGLVLVALLVGLSTLLTSESRRSADSPASGAGAAGGATDPVTADAALTDLGVEPAAAEPAIVQPPSSELETPQPVGPIVPDLQPDPQLKGTPRR